MDEAEELERLVGAARERDRDAVARLFDRYYDAIYRYAFARLGNVADAEDAAAETFTAMVRSLPRFRWRGIPFEAWLFRIAMSKVVDIARHRSRVRSGGDVVADDRTDPQVEPERVVALREVRRELVAAIERLPRDQRDVVMLRFFAGRSIRETGELLGRSEGAVKQLQFRALASLRRRAGR
ncbi:MAG TPA: sigma-70 family RNA polymerase sigma factor [Candidatus Limnocylindrales bacterium]|nr:sigma-70 family RNA polymerase sigma factor [Vitreimonas sp.]HVM23765.1 sigma-70 family RNA polymerase sigma factor [Candidatus Limnocylindrales bacterium]